MHADIRNTRQGHMVQTAAVVVAATFILVGIAGFIPGITTHANDLAWAGPDHDGPMPELLGLFHVSVLHNLVHIAFGVGLLMARTPGGARAFLVGGGVVYGAVFLYGALVDMGSDANFIPVNTADNWLHAGLAIGMIALGLALRRQAPDARRADTSAKASR